MKKFEIKRVNPLSFFKTFLYILLVPLTIYLILGAVVLVTGLVTQDDFFIHDGLEYFLNSVVVVFIYGIISILAPAIYNILAQRFGGLELTLEEKEDSM